jgi:hypothetical protein
MPKKRRHLESVLRRVTLGVSLVLLIAGVLIVGAVWSERKTEWNEATGKRTYDHPEVYVMHLGVVQFPPGSTDQQIKGELDRSAPAALEKAATRSAILRSLRIANPEYAVLTDSQISIGLLSKDPLEWSALSGVVIGEGTTVTLLETVLPSLFHLAPGDRISHLYLAASPGQSSMLYTRGQAMKAVAFSDGGAALVLEDLAAFYDSPRPRPAPFSLSRALALVTVGAVGLPWGTFFFLGWLVGGGSGTVSPDHVEQHVHVCLKCQSRRIAREERDDILDRLVEKARGRLAYRCLDCGHGFLDRPLSKH